MRCLLCNSQNTAFIFTFKGKDIYLEKLQATDFPLKWFQCYCCGVFFSQQYKGVEMLYADETLYDAQYDAKTIKIRFKKIMGLKEYESDNALRVRRIKQFHKTYTENFGFRKRKFKVLDIGTGTGVFLAKFLDRSYEGYALEINKVAAQHIREELRIKVYTVPVQELKGVKKYDVVTMNKVLEHIKHPIAILKSVRDVVTTSGIVYLELPDALNFKYYRDTAEAFTSGHYMVFNPQSLFYVTSRAGFEIVTIDRIIEPSGKITIYAFLVRDDNEIL